LYKKKKKNILSKKTIEYKYIKIFVNCVHKTAQIDYNNTKYTKTNEETFSIFISVIYQELQTQNNKCKKTVDYICVKFL